MQNRNAHEIFKESILKLDSIIAGLNTQLGIGDDDISQPEIKSKLNNETNQTINNQTNQTNTNKDVEKNKTNDNKTKTNQNTNQKPKEKSTSKPSKASSQEPQLYSSLDIRVGKVVSIKNVENSDKLYLLEIDVGEGKPRQIASGLRKYIPADIIEGSLVLVYANLKPKKLAGIESRGMVLTAHDENDTQFELPRPDESKIILFT